jgi:hypothetical protein
MVGRNPTRSTLIVLTAAVVGSVLVFAPVTGRGASGVAPASDFAGWTTVFRDDFNGGAGARLGPDWRYDVGSSYPGGAPQWGTGEIETVTDSTANVHQDGQGHLIVTPIRDANGQWTSGRVETARTDFAAPAGGQLALTASIQQPNPASGLGYWPAFWAMGAAARPVGATNWPSIGELDVMEDVNASSQVSHTFHCGVWGQPPCNEPDGISSGLLPCAGCQTSYHTYTVIQDRTDPNAEQLRFYTDGVAQFTVNQAMVDSATWSAALHHGFFMILDVAIAGSYPNKVCACNAAAGNPTSGAGMSVDYVAAYTSPASSASSPTPTPTRTPTPTPTRTPTPTSSSPGQGSRPASTPIQAEVYDGQSGTGSEPTTDLGTGQDVGWISDGDWLRYDRVDFGSVPLTQFQARVASGAANGVSGLVEVHLDAPTSPSIGSFAVANTGSWQTWRTVPANISGTTGVHTVYLEFRTGSGQDFVNVNWFKFA